ncbi:CubicO group peptidase, beta-lactamase class C family [Marivirga sericea]|uniref:CubicO group peptidase, beta-lactamase class C family n=1 Tax=Marivirga sericea TaxID=1028 RepID=A0A1X7IFZ4_9BACT|nr:serine hydrolase domain-containing protein [Marivirga sericea]SMG13721.1 CubicO group peptidase, beta-lactamase class C family [Marivirga sericea]
MKKLKNAAIITACIIAWTLFVVFGFINGYLLRTLDSSGSSEEFFNAAKNGLKTEFVGNLAMAMIEGGKVTKTYFYSHDGEKIDKHSAFPVASVSKWVTAVGILKLVEAGKLELDKPVEQYLSRWQLPETEFDNNEVTIRRLLSHSAGFDDQLGYNGFAADEKMQTLEESLKKAADAGSWTEGKARVGYEPGGPHMYSGASYTLLQLLIEEVTQMSYQEFMASQIFEPLGMKNASFLLADSTEIGLVDVYKTDSTIRPMKRFTAKAAAGLMISLDDLSKFMTGLMQSQAIVLSPDMIEKMRSPQSYKNGHAFYGLGPRLYGHPLGKSRTMGHDGSGNDAINAAVRMDVETSSGIIILETGHFSYASDIADEWLFWKAGIADRVVMQRNIPYLIGLLVFGYLFILVISIWTMRIRK